MSLRDEIEKVLRSATIDYQKGAAAPGDGIHSFTAKRVEAFLSLLPPKGWRLVPEEPTFEMLAAADSAMPRFEAERDGSRLMGADGALDAWKAMLSAAPVTKTEGGGNADPA